MIRSKASEETSFDGFVNAADQIIARSNATPIGGDLKLITVPAALVVMVNQTPSLIGALLTDSVAVAKPSAGFLIATRRRRAR
jgi:hypothetical protein